MVLVFTFYMAVAKNERFWPRFLEMLVLSFAVAAITFVFAGAVRTIFGFEI